MKKIIIKESQLNELFSTDYIYPVKQIEKTDYHGTIFYRYEFKTKDNVTYNVLLSINENGVGKLDFSTRTEDNDYYQNSIELINTKDAVKSLNTIKSIIDNHPEMTTIVISSTEDRIPFYKKILDHLKIRNELKNKQTLIGYLKGDIPTPDEFN